MAIAHSRSVMGKLILSTACLAGLGAGTGPAFAQASDAREGETHDRVIGDSGEIVVTAQKREQRLQDVPMSIAAISGAELEQRGLTTIEDYARAVPGLSTVSSAARSGVIPVIRGVQLGDQAPATAFYIDELPVQPLEFERTGVPDPNVFDVERVEILKGPQGSIYGGNSLGGLVKVVPAAPKLSTLEGSAAVQVSQARSSDTSYAMRGMINLPIVEDRLAVRLAAAHSFEGGMIDTVPYDKILAALPFDGTVTSTTRAKIDDLKSYASRNVDDTKTESLRASAAWKPIDALKVTASYFHQQVKQDRVGRISANLYDLADVLIAPDNHVPDSRKVAFDIATLKLEAALGWASIVSTTGYYRTTWTNRNDVTALLQNVLDGYVDPSIARPILVPSVQFDDGAERQWAHETRLATDFDFPVNVVAGVYYRNVRQTFDQFIIDDGYAPYFGTGLMFSKEGEYDRLKEYAVFGQATLNINDRIVVEAGARWYHYDRKQSAIADGLLGFALREFSGSGSVVSPSASATYKFTRDNNVYIRAASGFRPGFGFNTALFPDSCSAELKALGIERGASQVGPDKVWNYEIGTKNQFFGRRLRFNASAYRIDWRDLQSSLNLACGYAVRANVGTARVEGVEAELGVRLTDGLNFSVSAAHTDARIREADARQPGVSEGDRIPGSPRWSLNATADWTKRIGDDKQFYALLGYTYAGSFYYDIGDADARRRKPALGLFDARIGLNWKAWDLSLFGRNLSNSVKKGACIPIIGGINNILIGDYSTCINRPRTVGFELKRSI